MAKNESYSHCRCPTASKYNLSITHWPPRKIMERPQWQQSGRPALHNDWKLWRSNKDSTYCPGYIIAAHNATAWGGTWKKMEACVLQAGVSLLNFKHHASFLHRIFLDFFSLLLSLKASLSFSRMVKNAVESGRSFISFVPVGGVGHRLTNGPVKMLQLSE